MGNFKIPSTRFPGDVAAEVEQAIQGKDCSVFAFVITAVRAALENLKNGS